MHLDNDIDEGNDDYFSGSALDLICLPPGHTVAVLNIYNHCCSVTDMMIIAITSTLAAIFAVLLILGALAARFYAIKGSVLHPRRDGKIQ